MADESLNLENLLQMGIRAAKKGNKPGAKVYLDRVLSADKRNDRAWMWMAYVTDDELERRRYLKTALRLNPNNQSAQRALERLDHAKEAAQNRTVLYGSIAVAGLILFAAIACVLALALA